MSKNGKRKQKKIITTYSLLDEILASDTKPLSVELRTYQLTRMYNGLKAIEISESPTVADWKVVSDAINMLETLIVELKVCEDESNLLQDAITAMDAAKQRSIKENKKIRLDGEGIKNVRAALENYAQIIDVLPARTMLKCHRLTEKKLQAN